MRQLKYTILLTFFVILVASIVHATTIPVHFNGNFENGTTLFSDPIFIASAYLYGNDTYPIRDLICEMVTSMEKHKECVDSTPKSKGHCTIITENVTKEVCKNSNPDETFFCKNPGWGAGSNIFRLSNFKWMKVSNDLATNFSLIKGKDIPYRPHKLRIQNQTIIFKVTIPKVCSPAYPLDEAITIENSIFPNPSS